MKKGGGEKCRRPRPDPVSSVSVDEEKGLELDGVATFIRRWLPRSDGGCLDLCCRVVTRTVVIGEGEGIGSEEDRRREGGDGEGGELEVDPEPTREATERERSLPRFIARWRVVRGF